jgi:hypothetical protein
MVEQMKNVAKLDVELTVEERNLLSVASVAPFFFFFLAFLAL